AGICSPATTGHAWSVRRSGQPASADVFRPSHRWSAMPSFDRRSPRPGARSSSSLPFLPRRNEFTNSPPRPVQHRHRADRPAEDALAHRAEHAVDHRVAPTGTDHEQTGVGGLLDQAAYGRRTTHPEFHGYARILLAPRAEQLDQIVHGPVMLTRP